MSKERNVLDYLKNYMSSRCFWVTRILALGLCILHDKTKYKVCRSFTDLFHWPNGFCLDMIVVITFFLVVMIILYLDYVHVVQPIGDETEAIILEEKSRIEMDCRYITNRDSTRSKLDESSDDKR